MAARKSAPQPRYDASNAKKSGIGVFVILCNASLGEERQLLFGENARWRWKKIAGKLALEVEDNEEIALHAWATNVVAVGGPQVLFRDAQWK